MRGHWCSILALSVLVTSEVATAADEGQPCPAGFKAGGAFDGVWTGFAEKDGKRWPIEISVYEDTAGDRTARITLRDWVVHHQPLQVTGATGERLCLKWQIWDSGFDLRRNGDALQGDWRASKGRNARLSLARTTQPPFRPVETDVTFDGFNGAKLSGTLILPAGRGPFPVIIWTHGSGPDTRSTVHYASRAYLAVQQGAGAFVYDKRGDGDSTGEAAYDMRNVIGDARAAAAFVTSLDRVAPKRVFIGGYSQGGWVAPAVAAELPIAGLIVGSAPGITPAEQNIWNFRNEARGVLPEEMVEKAAEVLRATYEYYRTGKGYEAIVAALKDPANSAWAEHEFYRKLLLIGDGELPLDPNPDDYRTLFMDPLPWWRKINQPVLAVWGARDKAVPAGLSRDLISRALAKAGNKTATLRIFENAGHGLMVEPSPDDEWDWPRAADGYPELFKAWIKENVVHRK